MKQEFKQEFKQAVTNFRNEHYVKGEIELNHFTHTKHGECYSLENFNNGSVIFLKEGRFIAKPYSKRITI